MAARKTLAKVVPHLQDAEQRRRDTKRLAADSSFFEGARGLKLFQNDQERPAAPRKSASSKKAVKSS